VANPSKKLSLRICFKAVDKEGYSVALERDCWYGHILKGHRKQMIHRLHDVKTTIERSDRVDRFFTGGTQNRVYFKRWEGRDRWGNDYLKVAAEVIDPVSKIVRVLTAYPVRALPRPPESE
jgi:hypothetical protein